MAKTAKIALLIIFMALAGGFGYYFGLEEIDILSTDAPTYTPLKKGETVWFENLKNVKGLLEVKSSHSVFEAVRKKLENPDEALGKLPKKLETDKSPRALFLSVSNSREHAKVALGTGRGFRKALEASIKKMNRLLPQGYEKKWIKLDIVKKMLDSRKLKNDRTLSGKRVDFELTGLAFDRELSGALMPDEILSSNVYDRKKKRLNIARIASYLQKHHGNRQASASIKEFLSTTKKQQPMYVFLFRTTGFFNDGEKTKRLFRGHKINKNLTKEDLKAAAAAGAKYLTESTREDGSIVYTYKTTYDKEGKGYNYLRHGGTVYSMIDTYRVTKNEETLKAGKRAIDYLIGYMKPFQGREDAYCLAASHSVKLGGAGLALIAMAQYYHATGDNQYVPMMQKLANYIALEQDEEGKFVHKRKWPSLEKSEFTSKYYPGEAMYGLGALYEIDKNEKWLDVSAKSADYLINVRDKGIGYKKIYHDHWLILALNILYRHRPKEIYINQAMNIAKGIMYKQRKEPKTKDWLGSYHSYPRSTPSGCRGEGLNAAYRLARDYKKTEYIDDLIKAMHLNMHFQLACQYTPASSMYIPNPQRALGGLKGSFRDYEVRNDYVQHNISSIVNFYRVLEEDNIDLLDPNLESFKTITRTWPYDTVYPAK